MIVNFSSVYNEKGVSFKISHKVFKLLMNDLTNLKLKAVLPDNISKRDAIGFLITTDRNASEIIVSNPVFPRKSRFVEIRLALPFLDIQDKNDYMAVFLDNLKNACLLGFQKIGIVDSRIETVFSNTKEIVVNNDQYDYKEPFIPKIDF